MMPPLSIHPRIAIVAAHPDDETIGASSVFASGQSVHVLFVTDGAPRDSKLWPEGFTGDRDEYARLRRGEAEAALGRAGVARERLHWLGGLDQESVDIAPALARTAAKLLHKLGARAVLSHPYEGGHPDHDAAALVARLAIVLSGGNALLYEMTSYHAREGALEAGSFLPAAGPEWTVPLGDVGEALKREMFRCYASQKDVLRQMCTSVERFRAAPLYDFTHPPHGGRLLYELFGWASWADWRRRASPAVDLL